MKIQIASDLHLEFYESPRLRDFIAETNAPFLALMGDIGIPYLLSYENFLKECSESYSQTFIISGNHEYYQHKNKGEIWNIDKTNSEIERIVSKFINVHFLNNKYYQLDDNFVILGTTLWSDIPDDTDESVSIAINDFKNIYYFDGSVNQKVTPKYITSLHKSNVKWLEQTINNFSGAQHAKCQHILEPVSKNHTSTENAWLHSDKKIIIMSHHLPSYKMISPKYKNSPVNCCFASNLDHLILPNIVYWLSGHTHDSVYTIINSCRCIVNPAGYLGENRKYIENYVINLNNEI